MKASQKKSLIARMFGDNASFQVKPKCLFCEEWELEKQMVYFRLAQIIVSLLPERERGVELTQKIATYLSWSCPDAIKPWVETNPKPLLGRDDFLHHLCELILEEEKGGEE